MFGEGVNNETIIIVVSAFMAMISFVAFALPLLNRNEKKEHFQAIIERRRKDLFAQTQAEVSHKGERCFPPVNRLRHRLRYKSSWVIWARKCVIRC